MSEKRKSEPYKKGIIRLNDDWVIEVNDMSYMLKKDRHRKDKNGDDVYTISGYYTSLEGALKGFRKELIRYGFEDKAMSVKEALKVVEKANKEFDAVLLGVMESRGE